MNTEQHVTELRQHYAEFNGNPEWDYAAQQARELLPMCTVEVHDGSDMTAKYAVIVAPTGKWFTCASPDDLRATAWDFNNRRYWL